MIDATHHPYTLEMRRTARRQHFQPTGPNMIRKLISMIRAAIQWLAAPIDDLPPVRIDAQADNPFADVDQLSADEVDDFLDGESDARDLSAILAIETGVAVRVYSGGRALHVRAAADIRHPILDGRHFRGRPIVRD